MDLQYVKNQTDDSAEIFLYSPIGGGVNAQNFVSELQFLDSLGLKEINVRINSSGGSVIEGFGIFSAIRNAKTTVNTSIDGIAASIAGIIAQAGATRTITDFGRLMVHDPSFAGNNKDPKAQKALETIKSSLVTILTNNSSLDEAEVSKLMTEETWFNAEEAVAFGFAEEVTTTARKEATNELVLEDILNIANDLFAAPSSDNDNNNQIENDMLNVTNHLGLNEEATQEEVLEAVKVLENKVTEAEAALTTANDDNTQTVNELKETITTNDTAIETLTNEVATMVVENAITAGKFSKENKEDLVKKAVADLDGFKSIVNAVATPAVSITSLIDQKGDEKEVIEMTFEKMSKEDPSGLLNMLKTDPTAYKALYAKQYGSEPKI